MQFNIFLEERVGENRDHLPWWLDPVEFLNKVIHIVDALEGHRSFRRMVGMHIGDDRSFAPFPHPS
jgi:hypothetical protein